MNREAADHVAVIEFRVHLVPWFIFEMNFFLKFEIQDFYHENYMFISGRKSEDPIGE